MKKEHGYLLGGLFLGMAILWILMVALPVTTGYGIIVCLDQCSALLG